MEQDPIVLLAIALNKLSIEVLPGIRSTLFEFIHQLLYHKQFFAKYEDCANFFVEDERKMPEIFFDINEYVLN